MLFGRSGGKQAADNQQAAQGYGGQPQGTGPWQNAGGTPLPGSYPTQQAGTGYAGYSPAAGAQTAGGYAQAGAFSGNPYGGQAGGYTRAAGAYTQASAGYAQPAGSYPQGYAPAAGGYAQQAGGYVQPGTGYQQQSGSGGYAGGGYASGAFAANQQRYSGQPTGGYGGQQVPGAGGYPAGSAAGYAVYPTQQNGGNYSGTGMPGLQGTGYPGTGAQGISGAGQEYSRQAMPGGSVWQQMPSGQNQPQAGYQPGGYNPYAQMGRNQQAQAGQTDYSGQIPLNGGGYVPQKIPVRKEPFRFTDGMLILLSAVLLALFAVGLFVPGMNALLWVFLVLAAGGIAFFWVRPVTDGNRRLCFTIIFAVLGIVALLTATGLLAGMRNSRQAPAGSEQTVAENSGTGAASSAGTGSGTVVDPQTGNVISAVAQEQPTAAPTEAASDSATTERLESFFRFWSAGMQDEMLTLCSPSWQSGVDNPKTALFGLLANRRPLDYTVERISGTPESTSRTVTVTSTIDRNNGKDPVKYRLSVLMVKESEQWYVDPQSLKTYESAETQDPATIATPTPTAEPPASASTVLYYNPDGGTKYHLDQNCKSTHAKFLPLKGHFTYGEVNDDKYKNLSPCNVCAAPLR